MEESKIVLLVQKGFKILSYVSLGFGVVFFFVILAVGGTPETPRVLSIVALIIGVVYFMLFILISEVLKLLIQIEKNTRKSSGDTLLS